MREKNRKVREKKRLEEKGLLKENGEEIIEELNDWGGDDPDADADAEIGSDEILPTSDPNIGSNSIISQPSGLEKVNKSSVEDLEHPQRGYDRRVSNVSSKWHDIDEDQFSKKGDEGQLERLKQEMKDDLRDSFDEGDGKSKTKAKSKKQRGSEVIIDTGLEKMDTKGLDAKGSKSKPNFKGMSERGVEGGQDLEEL